MALHNVYFIAFEVVLFPEVIQVIHIQQLGAPYGFWLWCAMRNAVERFVSVLEEIVTQFDALQSDEHNKLYAWVCLIPFTDLNVLSHEASDISQWLMFILTLL